MAKKPEIQPDLFHVAHWTLKLLQYQDFHTESDREFLTAFANAYLLSKSRLAKFIATKRNWLQQSSVQIKDPYQLLS